jgi:hypothetical protein
MAGLRRKLFDIDMRIVEKLVSRQVLGFAAGCKIESISAKSVHALTI